MELIIKSNMLVRSFFIFLLTLPLAANLVGQSEKYVKADFFGKRKMIELYLTNLSSDSIIRLPNTMRMFKLTSSEVSLKEDTLVLQMVHFSGNDIVLNETTSSTIVRQGVLAYEKVHPGKQKKYAFKLPRSYRRSKKFKLVQLLFDEHEIIFNRIPPQ